MHDFYPRTVGGSIRYLFVLTLLFAPVVSAQNPPVATTQNPPVVVLKTSSFVTSSECKYGYGKCFKVTYKNVSDKLVKAIEFDIVFIDVMGDKHTYPHKFLTEGTGWLSSPVKPGTKGTAIWDNLLYDYCRKYETTVTKVAFTDGTFWEPKAE
jgi:hypothetical protein